MPILYLELHSSSRCSTLLLFVFVVVVILVVGELVINSPYYYRALGEVLPYYLHSPLHSLLSEGVIIVILQMAAPAGAHH